MMHPTTCQRTILALLLAGSVAHVAVSAQRATRGTLLENLTWIEAKEVLTAESVVVIPLGAAAKEHGPHLRLDNDWRMAEYLKRRVLARADVVVAPTVNYNFYPAFVRYPGSTSLALATARDLIVDICGSLASYGPRRFYVLNTGVSTLKPLAEAETALAAEKILLRYTDPLAAAGLAIKAVSEQREGTHADEIETSMMLYIAPERVDMSKASRDFPLGTGPLTPDKRIAGSYSPSGIYGDATLATRAKGQTVVEALIGGILRDIDALRRLPLPQP
jgi:creatinine amidohydrolase